MKSKTKYSQPFTEMITCTTTHIICASNQKTWNLGDPVGPYAESGDIKETDGTNFDGWTVSAKKQTANWDNW